MLWLNSSCIVCTHSKVCTILMQHCYCTVAAERLQSVLSWVGVSTSDLSQSALKCVQSVPGIAVALGTRDCSDTRYMYMYDIHSIHVYDSLFAVICKPLHIVVYIHVFKTSNHLFSLCLALTDVSQRQASLTVRDGEVEKASGKREEDLRSAVVTQATQKQ